MSSSSKRRSPSCELLDLVVDMNWDAVKEHAAKFPEDAQWEDHDGRDGGETPLYLAVQYNAPVSAIQSIISAYPEAVRMKNRNGNTPLHIACHYDARIEILDVLLQADPSTVFLGTKWGKTPLNALYDGIIKRAASTDILVIDAEPWEKMELLLRAAALGESLRSNGGDWLILHAAVSLGSLGCPERVFELTMEHYAAQVYERDQMGRLPLQIAAGPCRRIRFGPNFKRQYKPRERHVFDLLLRHFPEAARELDRQGRWPLHSALANGHAWEGGVDLLCHAAPDAISVVDPVTGLLPFLLAGVPVGETSPSLSTVFQLLSFQPDLLGSCRLNPESFESPGTIVAIDEKSSRGERKSVVQQSIGLRFAVSVAAFAACIGSLTALAKWS